MSSKFNQQDLQKAEDFLLGRLNKNEQEQLQAKMETDQAFASTVNQVKAAIAFVEKAELKQAIRQTEAAYFVAQRRKATRRSAVKRIGLVAAASISGILGWKYATLDGAAVADQMAYYQPQTLRGQSPNANQLANAYQQQQYEACDALYQQMKSPSAEAALIAGNALLALKKPNQALNRFEEGRAISAKSGSSIFINHYDWYEAKAWVMNQQYEKAYHRIMIISRQEAHIFHHEARTVLRWKLYFLRWKQ